MRMIGYMGGDANTLVVRRAIENDVRVAIEFQDHNFMLAIVVMQTGEVCLGQTAIRGSQDVLDDLVYVANVEEDDEGKLMIDIFDKPVTIKQDKPVVEFSRLHVVGDNDD
jgi:nitrate reductase gamma subunit